MKENLWLNMTDGAILCGRRYFDGSGGNNHAVEHYRETGYPLAVKLGTITPDGAGEKGDPTGLRMPGTTQADADLLQVSGWRWPSCDLEHAVPHHYELCHPDLLLV